MAKKKQTATFDYSLDFKTIDFRKHPEKYRIGKGEQGVLLVEPYKSEIIRELLSPNSRLPSRPEIFGAILRSLPPSSVNHSFHSPGMLAA